MAQVEHPEHRVVEDEAQAAEAGGPEKKSVLKKVKDKVKRIGSKLKPKSHGSGGDESKQDVIEDSNPGEELDDDDEEAVSSGGAGHPDSRETQVPLDEFALIQQKEKEKKDKEDSFEFKKSDDLTAGLPDQAIAEQQEPADALQAVPTSYNYKETDDKPDEAQRDNVPEDSVPSEERKDGSIFASESGKSVQATPREVEALSSSNLYTGEPDVKSGSQEKENIEPDAADVKAEEVSKVDRGTDTPDFDRGDEAATKQQEIPSEHAHFNTKKEEPKMADDPMAQEQEEAKPTGGAAGATTPQADEHLGDSKVDAARSHEPESLGEESAEPKVGEEKSSDSKDKSGDKFLDANSTEEPLERTDDAPSVEDIKEREPEALPQQESRDLRQPSEPSEGRPGRDELQTREGIDQGAERDSKPKVEDDIVKPADNEESQLARKDNQPGFEDSDRVGTDTKDEKQDFQMPEENLPAVEDSKAADKDTEKAQDLTRQDKPLEEQSELKGEEVLVRGDQPTKVGDLSSDDTTPEKNPKAVESGDNPVEKVEDKSTEKNSVAAESGDNPIQKVEQDKSVDNVPGPLSSGPEDKAVAETGGKTDEDKNISEKNTPPSKESQSKEQATGLFGNLLGYGKK